MLKHLKVEGFKSIRLATVELGAVNVFIGANGSGKLRGGALRVRRG